MYLFVFLWERGELIVHAVQFFRFLGLIKMQVSGKFRRLLTSMYAWYSCCHTSSCRFNLVTDISLLTYVYFFRLSLQYHPDKNKSKGAQEKFSQINNGIIECCSLSPSHTHTSSYSLEQKLILQSMITFILCTFYLYLV